MTCTDKDIIEVSFNLKQSGSNTMHTLFYSNKSEFAGNLNGMLDEGKYKTTIHNMQNIGWKANISGLE